MHQTNFQELLEAGAHFGHMKRKWNPAMAPYIFMERNGIHIIDLHKTIAKIEEAAKAIRQIAVSDKKVLFVSTKKQAKQVVAERATEAGMPYVTERWAGGMLTNFQTIRKAIRKMDNIDRMETDGTMDTMSKRERLQIKRQRDKLELNLGSIANMRQLPSAIFVVDVMREHIAVAEAVRLGIPVFGIVDTNSDPNNVDFVIPCNDDATKAIDIILTIMVDAIKEGRQENITERRDTQTPNFEVKDSRHMNNKMTKMRRNVGEKRARITNNTEE
jgi:small subunit ribosomal protein S2